jgi:hypothetical protein
MKFTLLALASVLVLFTGCATTNSGGNADSQPETVMITYHVKPGNEAVFEQMLWRAWRLYRLHHLVITEPHVVIRDEPQATETRFVEILTWVNRAAPENAPLRVKAVWEKMTSLCLVHHGQSGPDTKEVTIVPQAF